MTKANIEKTTKEVAQEEYEKNLLEAKEKGAIEVTDKEQPDQQKAISLIE